MCTVVPILSTAGYSSSNEITYNSSTVGVENTLSTLLTDALKPPVPLKHHQIRLELMYGASWPLYFDFPPDLLISTLTVQLCKILTALLHSGTNSDLESGRVMDSETASDGCSGLYIRLLDAPQVAPMIIPQLRRPDRRDRGTVLHDVTLPPADFNQNIS
jgi:hypothetical protein